MWRFLCLVWLVGCAPRVPHSHDGSCLGRAQATYEDCTEEVDGRFAAARVLTAFGNNPYNMALFEQRYAQQTDACRFEYNMRMQRCVMDVTLPRSPPPPPQPQRCTMDTECAENDVCEHGACTRDPMLR